MANLSENPQWVDGIYQIEMSDPVVGGPDGVSNRQAKELASRTSYLKKEQEKTGSDLATHVATADPHTQYAPKENPTFTGMPKAPMPAADSNSQQVATTAFVRSVGATKLEKDRNGADILDRELFNRNLGSSRAYSSSIPIGGSAGLWTTAEFTDWLESQGAFVHAYWVCRGSWSYAHNKIISDTGCGQIPLAGSVVEVMGQHSAITIRVTTPSTTSNGLSDSANAQFTYVYNGFDYSPGWRRDYNTKNKPTAADIGALPEKAVAQSAAKLATPRTINGVPFDGTANIALTTANLGLGETVDLAAGALSKAKNGADISDKTAFYNNVSLRGTLGNGMTFATCDKAGDYVVTITDPNTVSDMPMYKGQKLYGYGVLHVSRRDNFVGQEYINHSGDYAWRQKWDDGVYAPWVIALSSSRVPTATDVGALPVGGTAGAAAKLATPRTINGVAFDGSANIVVKAEANGGTATTTTGNAGSATKLETPRKINGVPFDGTTDINLNLGLKLKALGQYSPMNAVGVEFTAVNANTLRCYITRQDQGYYVELGVTKMVLVDATLTDVISAPYVRRRLAGSFPVTKITMDSGLNASNGMWEINYPNHGVAVGSKKSFYIMGLVYREVGMHAIGQVAEIDGLYYQMNVELDTPVSNPHVPIIAYAESELSSYFAIPIQVYGRKNFVNQRFGSIAHADFLDNSHISVCVSDNNTDGIIISSMVTVMVYDV